MIDILIKNAAVVDGSGSPGFKADLEVREDKITAIGELGKCEAHRVIDASGLIVTPGFVDMHSHADFRLPICPEAGSLVHQGITTVVVGQCGMSPAPLLDSTRKKVTDYLSSAMTPLPWDQWSSFGDYLSYLTDMGIALNIVPLVGQGMVRAAVMGYSSDRPDNGRLKDMRKLVAKALEEGAAGVSTGLIYPPGSYANTEEIISVCRPVAECKGLYSSHIRGEGDTLLEAVGEAVRIGRTLGCPVQISHFKAGKKKNWDKASKALELIDSALEEGLDVAADMYPYQAGCTFLHAMLPEWAQEGGKADILSRLKETGLRVKMEEDMETKGFFYPVSWEKILISNSPRKREYQGHYVAELAAGAGKTPYQWFFDTLIETEMEIDMIIFLISEDNIRMQLTHPAVMIGTDGSAYTPGSRHSKGLPHPRNYGAFPRVLGRYVREQKVLTLEEAVWKMTGRPAGRLGWKDRGLIREGYRADLVILDPETVKDEATYTDPHRYPTGIFHVMVNGRLVVQDGRQTDARPGTVLSSRQ